MKRDSIRALRKSSFLIAPPDDDEEVVDHSDNAKIVPVEEGNNHKSDLVNDEQYSVRESVCEMMHKQRTLLKNAIFVAGLIIGVAIVLLEMEGLVELSLVGVRSLDVGYEKSGDEDSLEGFDHAERFKGLDLVSKALLLIVVKTFASLTTLAFYAGWKPAIWLGLRIVPLTILTFFVWLALCYFVLNGEEEFYNVFQAWFGGFLQMTIPLLIAMTMKKGCNGKWFGRAIKWSMEPTLMTSTGCASSLYFLLNYWSESTGIVLNIVLMSLVFPICQFALRALMEMSLAKIYEAGKEEHMNFRPITLIMEMVLLLPGFLVMLRTDSDLAFYSSFTISLLFEVLELFPLLKFRGSSAGFGEYVGNLEQAEKIALILAVGMYVYIESSSKLTVRLIIRSTYALGMELLADICKDRLCTQFKVKLKVEAINMSRHAIALYILFGEVGVYLALMGILDLNYVL